MHRDYKLRGVAASDVVLERSLADVLAALADAFAAAASANSTDGGDAVAGYARALHATASAFAPASFARAWCLTSAGGDGGGAPAAASSALLLFLVEAATTSVHTLADSARLLRLLSVVYAGPFESKWFVRRLEPRLF